MNFDQLTLQAGLGKPPALPPDTPYYNVSRVQSLSKCEHRFSLDYLKNLQYAPERTASPAMWLGTWVHKWVEELHTMGWGNLVDPFVDRALSEASDICDEPDEKWDKVCALLPPLCSAYRDHYMSNQTYDKIHAAEQVFWVLWEGVCFLGTFDGIVELSGHIWDLDTKTSSRSAQSVFEDQRNSVQRLIYAEALDRLAGPVYGLPFGGAIVDYVSTALPLKPGVPRLTKSGEIHKTDARIIGEYAGKLAEYQAFGLQRDLNRALAVEKYRLDRAYQFGLFSTVRTAEALRTGLVEPVRVLGLNPWACKGCPHREACVTGTEPSTEDYYTREPDYVDRAREAL